MTDTPRGLTPDEVKHSRDLYGTNTIRRQGTHGFFPALASGFADPIIRILLVALAINMMLTFNGASWLEPLGIAVAVLITTVVSALSEYSSEAAFERMRAEAAATSCRVYRSGKLVTLPSAEIVVGDAVLLAAGEKITADGVMLSGELAVDQSSLNGESREAVKKAGNSGQTGLSAPEKLFAGSFVVSGEGVMNVTRVGEGTIYGKMALETNEDTRESPLRLRLGHLAGTLTKLGLTAAGLVAAADLFKTFLLDNHFDPALILASVTDLGTLTRGLIHALILTIAVVVVSVPEGLPLMTTVVLSSNMVRMMKSGVLVRKGCGIETAGSMDLLFTDKTGTLTAGHPVLVKLIDASGELLDPSSLVHTPLLRETLSLSALYNTSCTLAGNKVTGGDGTDRAILTGLLPLPAGVKNRRVTARLPFSSERKISACTLSDGRTFVKGAPELLLSASTRALSPDGKTKRLQASRLRRTLDEASAEGLRVVAVALSDTPVDEHTVLQDLTFVSFLCLRDTLRPTTRAAVETVKRAGIQVVMLTGDSYKTAVAVANEAGITRGEQGAYRASDLRNMTDDELAAVLPELRVIARSLPSDKSRLVRVAQEAGRVVGMTGDGVNDAPALKRADVGFAMGNGSDVAKDAGDVVLQTNDMAAIGKTVLFGRTIFHSIRKFLVYQLTMNLCAVGVSVLGPLIGVEMPITVIQMLWINLIMDTLAGLAFAGEPPLDLYMKESPKPRDARILTRRMLAQILRMGVFSLTLCLLFLLLPAARSVFPDERHFLCAFFTLFVFAGLSNAFAARTPDVHLLRGLKSNRPFLLIMAASAAIQLFLVRFGGTMFRTVPLNKAELLTVTLLALTVIPVDLLGKGIASLHRKKT